MLFSVILLVVLIFLNGIFSASELAFLSLDKIKLKKDIEKGNKKAININKILNNPASFLSTIQIGITLAGFLASAFAADYFADYFLAIINISFISISTLRTILVILITIVLSYFTLVFGELVPKRIAINNPFKVAYTFIGIINVVNILFYPLIKFLTFSTEFICKIFNIKENNDKLTEEDIKKIILLGKDEGILEEKEKDYILNVFNFNDIEVEKVMTPKKGVIMLNIGDDLKDNILKIKDTKYTRFPVYKDNIDNIMGVINVKDLIIQHRENENLNLESIIRKVSKFQYDEKIDDVFRYMQENNESICVIYKDKKFVGIVTVEDAVEEIVGNIYDEYDNVLEGEKNK